VDSTSLLDSDLTGFGVMGREKLMCDLDRLCERKNLYIRFCIIFGHVELPGGNYAGRHAGLTLFEVVQTL